MGCWKSWVFRYGALGTTRPTSTWASEEALGQVGEGAGNPMTDGGAVKAGVGFIRIDPVKTTGDKWTKRIPQKAFRGAARGVSDVYDQVLDRSVYRG